MSVPNHEALVRRLQPVAALLGAGLLLCDEAENPLAAAGPPGLSAPPPAASNALVTCPVPGRAGTKGSAMLMVTVADAATRARLLANRAQLQVWLRQLATDLAPLLARSAGGDPSQLTLQDLWGIDHQYVAVRELARRVAPTDSTVLIRGESGTGKELFARAIHTESQVCKGPFVAINCAAIPEHLLESELFGYEDGAFTGARRGGKPGRLELAAGGTLFLDEVGDLPLHLQAKLLRVLQFREVERVGGVRTVSLDFRLIGATNRPLEDLVSQNSFREDLFYRLNVISLTIPPLRERKDDLVMLLELFTKRYCLRFDLPAKCWSAEALGAVLRYRWPGNIRELQNVVERVVVLQQGDMITADSLPPEVRAARTPAPERPPRQPPAPEQAQQGGPAGRRSTGPTEAAIRAAVARHADTASGRDAAAGELGMSRATLYRRLRELRI